MKYLLSILCLFVLSCNEDDKAIQCASAIYDCTGLCDGDAEFDGCDICDGDNSTCIDSDGISCATNYGDCFGDCDGAAVLDGCVSV